ncbi:unnamed protein product [Microthlaspi erraticum]|uniref:Uncharacterized protein n=1 Tax=Microthlaspi erraticum TaxID=1685480 RepID=A0A6D2KJ07_9BRAS|nr:unnamed protein product [Microthlaspi erraticum]
MAKTKKTSKKRKSTVADDEPEFIHTIPAEGDGGRQEETQPDDTQLEDTEPGMAEGTIDSQMDVHEAVRESTEEQTRKETSSQDGAREDVPDTAQRRSKKHRGPTKMKDIAKDPNTRIKVEFTELGEPCGEGSMTGGKSVKSGRQFC